MSTKTKLNTEDFYHQFYGHEHHNDPGEYVKPHWFEINPTRKQTGKRVSMKALAKLRAAKRRKSAVVVHKGMDAMRLALTMKKVK
jgi:hypothetical protein